MVNGDFRLRQLRLWGKMHMERLLISSRCCLRKSNGDLILWRKINDRMMEFVEEHKILLADNEYSEEVGMWLLHNDLIEKAGKLTTNVL